MTNSTIAPSASMTRRGLLIGGSSLLALTAAGCATTSPRVGTPDGPSADALRMYAALPGERFPIPAMPIEKLDPRYYRQIVADPTGQRPGTVVVHTPSRYLYWTMEGGRAMRYGVGIGREGFTWGGTGTIAYKREWPRWTPPAEMIRRQPELERYRNGMEPGLENPLGARALYIFEDGRDTLYRLHGTLDVDTIGKAVSSGCVRLMAQDVIDLYERVPNGSPIVVVQS